MAHNRWRLGPKADSPAGRRRPSPPGGGAGPGQVPATDPKHQSTNDRLSMDIHAEYLDVAGLLRASADSAARGPGAISESTSVIGQLKGIADTIDPNGYSRATQVSRCSEVRAVGCGLCCANRAIP